jgi:hypothetical protein
MKVDLEPTWLEIFNMVKSGHLKLEDSYLERACIAADIVRQAEKSGCTSVRFSFRNGEVFVDEYK